MTKTSIMELTQAVKERYRHADRKTKTQIVNEYCANTGHHRKAALRSINKPKSKDKRRGPRTKYHPMCTIILEEIWKLMDYICPDRFYDSIPSVLKLIQDKYPAKYVDLVTTMSLRTVRRRLEGKQRPSGRQRRSPYQQYNYEQIPVNSKLRKAKHFGYVGVNFVNHDGGNVSGIFCRTLTLVDVKTIWTTNGACLGQKQDAVISAFDITLGRFPDADIHQLHPDNEDSLLAVSLLQTEAKNRRILAVTRSRPGKKNDNCNVEERNNERVRKHVGYKRYTAKHLPILNRLYAKLDDYCNFFIPSMKLKAKVYNENHKAIRRVYDGSKTPYQRVLECEEIDVKIKMKLMHKYHTLDILRLRKEIDNLLHELAGA